MVCAEKKPDDGDLLSRSWERMMKDQVREGGSK
jgi:hypothetical protein